VKNLFNISLLVTSLTFLYYGFATFFLKTMKQEFERYEFSRFRNLTGSLQILGASGLLLGTFYKPLLLTASLGLAVMMLFAIGIRRKIGDPFLAKIPALIFLSLNIFIFMKTLFPIT
jgi:hypothetical protein